ncbi:DUF421 domain-containing protein [Numidum massiliense]|uniref:DUF421 domain-containing protein n=1 Tax=Numidum massiliense TaxID=1522315 RepID=UPI0011CBB0B1|nr:DUF421 domain-containing protein [Numidum massiliense]
MINFMTELTEHVLTPLAIFAIFWISLRIMGKRAVSELSTFDLAIVVLLGNSLTEPIAKKGFFSSMLLAAVFVLSHLLLNFFSYNNRLRKKVIGRSIELIRHGKINEKNLKKARMTIPQLLGALRVKGYVNPQNVEFAFLEEMGQISVIAMPEHRPLKPSDIGLTPPYSGIPVPLVIDGVIQDNALRRLKIDREWLWLKLVANGVTRDLLPNVALALLDAKGSVHVDWNNDPLQGAYQDHANTVSNQVKQSLQKDRALQELGFADDYLKPHP